MTFWKISYTIQDGINEYADSITCRFAGKQLDGVTAASKIADAWNLTDPDEAEAREQFITALASEGRADFPYDAREICALAWEQLDPIRITISDGLIESITGIPEGVTVEIRDWDGAFEDETGEWVPAVSEWAGPL